MVFRDEFFGNINKRNELNEWCEKEFKTSFIEPLLKFCKTPHDIPNASIIFKRDKRLALLAIGLVALITIAVSATIGVASTAIVQTNENKANVNEIKKIQQENLNRLVQIEDNEKKVKSILALLQKEIDGISDQV
jgi:hypothetical protein